MGLGLGENGISMYCMFALQTAELIKFILCCFIMTYDTLGWYIQLDCSRL